jgi:hypothetical protein
MFVEAISRIDLYHYQIVGSKKLQEVTSIYTKCGIKAPTYVS